LSEKIEFVIWARDKVSGALRTIGAGFTRLGKIARGIGSGMGAVFRRMRSAALPLGAAVGFLGASIKKAFDFEKVTTEFKVLFGSLALAKKHVTDLQKLSAKTPFQFEDLADASKKLEILTAGMLNTEEHLIKFGDAAAATGQDIGDVSFWIGRAYSAIQSGEKFGEASMRLLEMGILTGEAKKEMEELSDVVGSSDAVWAVLEKRLAEFTGGMDELSKTGHGVFSTLKDNITLAMVDIGGAFLETSKGGMQALIDKIQDLRSSGTLAAWAEAAHTKLLQLKETAASVLAPIAAIGKGLIAGGGARSAAFDVIKFTIINAFVEGGKKAASAIKEAMLNPIKWRVQNILGSALGKTDLPTGGGSGETSESSKNLDDALARLKSETDKATAETSNTWESQRAAAFERTRQLAEQQEGTNAKIKRDALQLIKAKEKSEAAALANQKKSDKEAAEDQLDAAKKGAELQKDVLLTINDRISALTDIKDNAEDKSDELFKDITDPDSRKAKEKAARVERDDWRGIGLQAARGEALLDKNKKIPRHLQRALDLKDEQIKLAEAAENLEKAKVEKDKIQADIRDATIQIRDFQEKLLTFKN
jgi:hypothetical protein